MSDPGYLCISTACYYWNEYGIYIDIQFIIDLKMSVVTEENHAVMSVSSK